MKKEVPFSILLRLMLFFMLSFALVGLWVHFLPKPQSTYIAEWNALGFILGAWVLDYNGDLKNYRTYICGPSMILLALFSTAYIHYKKSKK